MEETLPSAEILAFPGRPQDRLRVAARRLEAALAEQSDALASLRANLSALSGAVTGLQGSLVQYQGSLASTAVDVARANEQARALEARADAMLAVKA